MLACEFFRVDCPVTPRRIYVFFVLEVASRSVRLLGREHKPRRSVDTEQARNLVMDLGE